MLTKKMNAFLLWLTELCGYERKMLVINSQYE
jgi:hypothetical protein